MKKLLLALIILSYSAGYMYSQQVTVSEVIPVTKKIDGQYYFPRFSPDDQKIFFSSANYIGLWYVEQNTGKITPFVSEQGAGYEFAFTQDGKSVVYRVNEYSEKGIRIAQKIVKKNFETNEQQIIETGRHLSAPKVLVNNDIAFTKEDNMVVKQAAAGLRKSVQPNPVVYIENTKLILYSGGVKKSLSPLGNDAHYIWPSLSPDNNKILFSVPGKGSFISDLNGKVLVELGTARYPRWSPDGKWISYMIDEDDGHVITGSEIFVVSADGKRRFQLTKTDERIEMYPEWANTSTSLVYHSDEGEIFVMKLKID